MTPCRVCDVAGKTCPARILVVEDDPDIALGMKLDLREEGYEAEVVRGGEEASRIGRQPGWDLFLLDVMLPRKDNCADTHRTIGRG
jgi:DNA-binding response OmpR family regulator